MAPNHQETTTCPTIAVDDLAPSSPPPALQFHHLPHSLFQNGCRQWRNEIGITLVQPSQFDCRRNYGPTAPPPLTICSNQTLFAQPTVFQNQIDHDCTIMQDPHFSLCPDTPPCFPLLRLQSALTTYVHSRTPNLRNPPKRWLQPWARVGPFFSGFALPARRFIPQLFLIPVLNIE